jgi:hypothetical protein
LYSWKNHNNAFKTTTPQIIHASTPSPINPEIIAAMIKIITSGDVNCSNKILKAEFLSFD